MGSIRRRGLPALAVMAGALLLPAGALGAVAKPSVTTGGIGIHSSTSAMLKGSVNPNGAPTTYLFQYGKNQLYDSRTGELSAGKGTKAVKVKIPIGSLTPNTTYHYRLVAQNRKGLTLGKDRTFKTNKEPLALTLVATPNPIRAGHLVTLSGALSGTGHANRQIKLESNTWPYPGWVQQGNPQVTGATGTFSFTILTVNANTQFRVSLVSNPTTVSPILVLGTTVKVTRHAKVFPGTRRGRIHFWGTLTPAEDGALVQIQKRRKGNWITIAQTGSKHTSKGFSRYSKRIRQKHGGRYRVVAIDTTGAHSVSASRSIRRHHLRG
jgi:hypothetical protein